MAYLANIYVIGFHDSWILHFYWFHNDHRHNWREAYYIIDTLGERLFECCNQAYVLKFDKDAEIKRLKHTKEMVDNENIEEYECGFSRNYFLAKELSGSSKRSAHKLSDINNVDEKVLSALADQGNQKAGGKNKSEQPEKSTKSDEQEVVVCRGKESCIEYIKSFLAAIPIQQVKVDMKKELVSSLHHRLQTEFHFIRDFQHQPNMLLESCASEATVSEAAICVTV